MKSLRAIPLARLVSFQTGYTSRSSTRGQLTGVWSLAGGDLQGGILRPTCTSSAPEDVSLERYGVRRGDVFFKSRGARFEAAILRETLEPMVFAAPLVRMQADPACLDPGYLVWFLNSEPVQAQLDASARGTNVRSVGPTELRSIEIPLPPLTTQKAIADLDALRRREADLMEHLAARRKLTLDRILHSELQSRSPRLV